MIVEILTAIYEAAEQKLLEDRNRRWQAGLFWQRALHLGPIRRHSICRIDRYEQ